MFAAHNGLQLLQACLVDYPSMFTCPSLFVFMHGWYIYVDNQQGRLLLFRPSQCRRDNKDTNNNSTNTEVQQSKQIKLGQHEFPQIF